jgi:hypothetical protein
MESIASALVLAMIVEMRMAVHRMGTRMAKLEGEQYKMKRMHALPALVVFCASLMLLGCGSPRPLAPIEPVTVGASFAGLGNTLVWTGGIVAVAGIGLRLAFPIIAPLAIVIVECAAGCSAVGGVFIWLGNNTWALVVGCCATVAAWVWYRWPSIRRWLDRRYLKKTIKQLQEKDIEHA